MPKEGLTTYLRQTYSLLNAIWDEKSKPAREKLIRTAMNKVGYALEIAEKGEPMNESKNSTYEAMYEKIRPAMNTKLSFKEYKKSAHPRTFNEMFGEGGDRLAENKTYEQIYRQRKLKEGIYGPSGNNIGSYEDLSQYDTIVRCAQEMISCGCEEDKVRYVLDAFGLDDSELEDILAKANNKYRWDDDVEDDDFETEWDDAYSKDFTPDN